ncbi:DEAD/DEAH box helicase [Shewanella gelidii]|uniref:ATP-dependent RNA helicase RhlE n=1 Tax=Shewanella gelidii TaxID=1642821 RepID=A0A917JUL4_9GAMM|nr:DEAD/DEAH box helicase [Shewanella gelidii]MCL1098046.1 DEAD/DEAH box helicase [Shewanella gelidii]GGI85731.1 ATP-dependent RNA helicase RhlE [Shewanella gelidii]
MPFTQLGLNSQLVANLKQISYQQPTPIQSKAIPAIFKGRDLLAVAETGTGKTASFVLPILNQLMKGQTQKRKRVRGLILVPTRELANQVEQSIQSYAKNTSLTSLAMYGGVESQTQKKALIDGCDILVATPGRLLDMYTQRAVYFEEIEFLVLDEADRMLDMGFIEDINKIIDKLPLERQNLLFSATLSKKVKALAKTAIQNPIEINTTPKQKSIQIEQWLTTVDKDKKSALLSHLIQQNQWQQALIFIETKQGAAKLVSQLEKRDIKADCIHSGKSQLIREQILADFKAGRIQYLIATGVAARGLDIQGLELVINYDLPFPAENYVHRIGRTGRAGQKGQAISLVSKDDFKNLCMIESLVGHLIERRVIEGFEPKKIVPISVLNFVPKHKRNTAESQNKATSQKANNHINKKPRSEAKANAAKEKNTKKATDDLNPWNL